MNIHTKGLHESWPYDVLMCLRKGRHAPHRFYKPGVTLFPDVLGQRRSVGSRLTARREHTCQPSKLESGCTFPHNLSFHLSCPWLNPLWVSSFSTGHLKTSSFWFPGTMHSFLLKWHLPLLFSWIFSSCNLFLLLLTVITFKQEKMNLTDFNQDWSRNNKTLRIALCVMNASRPRRRTAMRFRLGRKNISFMMALLVRYYF